MFHESAIKLLFWNSRERNFLSLNILFCSSGVLSRVHVSKWSCTSSKDAMIRETWQCFCSSHDCISRINSENLEISEEHVTRSEHLKLGPCTLSYPWDCSFSKNVYRARTCEALHLIGTMINLQTFCFDQGWSLLEDQNWSITAIGMFPLRITNWSNMHSQFQGKQ